MRTRTRRATGGLLAAVAILATMGACGSSSIVSGSAQIYGPFETTPEVTYTWPADTGDECDDPDSDLAFNGDNTITGSATTDTLVSTPFGDWHVRTTVTVTSGTWAHRPPAPNISGTLEIASTYWTTGGDVDCETDDGECTITFLNVAFTGTTDTAMALPTFLPGDTITIDGGNTTFETTVTGQSCGILYAVDSGYIELHDVVIEI